MRHFFSDHETAGIAGGIAALVCAVAQLTREALVADDKKRVEIVRAMAEMHADANTLRSLIGLPQLTVEQAMAEYRRIDKPKRRG